MVPTTKPPGILQCVVSFDHMKEGHSSIDLLPLELTPAQFGFAMFRLNDVEHDDRQASHQHDHQDNSGREEIAIRQPVKSTRDHET